MFGWVIVIIVIIVLSWLVFKPKVVIMKNEGMSHLDDGGSYPSPGGSYPSPPISNWCPSACNSGGIGYQCPQTMLLSDEMTQAASTDGNEWANYALAGFGNTNKSDCCKCYQVSYTGSDSRQAGGPGPQQSQLSPGNPNGPWGDGSQDGYSEYPKKDLIVQAFNVGGDVAENQFDIYMAAGGLGIFNACDANSPSSPFYGGSNWPGEQYGGIQEISDCDSIPETRQDSYGNSLKENCKKSFQGYYHGNWGIKFTPVKCPDGLYKLSGCKRADDSSLPDPKPGLASNGTQGYTTSMMDCCKPACAWNGIPNLDQEYNSIYTCRQDATSITTDNHDGLSCVQT